jgi:leucyl aminopeptidase (aminopeptidase T)
MTSNEKAARLIFKDCLNVEPHESLHIVAEETFSDVADVLWKRARMSTRFAQITLFSHQFSNYLGLPPSLYNSLGNSDCVVILSPNLISERLFDSARQKGTRILLLTNATRTLFEHLLKINFQKIATLSRRIADIFSIGKTLVLNSPNGTDVKINLVKTKGRAVTGQAKENGQITTLPAGEACVTLTSNVEGDIILDRICGQTKGLNKPITLKIKNGVLTQVKGSQEAEQLRKAIRRFGNSGRKINELGIGTNDNVTFGQSQLGDEKVYGTAHIAIGEYQITKVHGKIIQAIKGVIVKPTISIDGKMILEDGKVLV